MTQHLIKPQKTLQEKTPSLIIMNWLLESIITLLFFSEYIFAQQKYSGNSVLDCSYKTNMSGSSLYTCNNGQTVSCKAFLIFTANPPYDTVPAISSLTSSDQSEIAKLNNLKTLANFPTGQEIIVPVSCSCSSDMYYEATTTYTVLTESESYFTVANNTYQGLSTCDSIKRANGDYHSHTSRLSFGDTMRVPLRCACPTRQQDKEGIRFLVTYSIGFGDTLYALSKQFNVSMMRIIESNTLSRDELSTIYPFTTVLIPMENEPSSSHTLNRGYIPNTTSPFPPPIFRKNNRPKTVISAVGISAGAFSLLILLLLIIAIILFRKKETRNGKKKVPNYSPKELILEIASFDRALKAFKFSEIKKATRNFGSKNRKEGSCVYRGTFEGEILAVKKIGGIADNEVKMLQKINHFNLVKLRGFCEEGKDTSYLVYEYMKNGSLQEWLGRRSGSMSWHHVIGIALDVANGLLYLHNFANPAYIHNNIRSENILLDGNLRAKISNFSLATTIDHTNIAKSVATKVDVFYFGVVLLEIITGKYSVFDKGDREIILTTTVAAIMESENVETALRGFISHDLVDNGGLEYALLVVRLCLSCFRQDPKDRPEIIEVVSILLKLQFSIQKPLLCGVISKKMDFSMENEITTSFISSSSVF